MDQFCAWLGINSVVIGLSLYKRFENDCSNGGLVGLHDVRRYLHRASPLLEEVLGRPFCDYYRQMNLKFWQK
jgi:hypothetical protein